MTKVIGTLARAGGAFAGPSSTATPVTMPATSIPISASPTSPRMDLGFLPDPRNDPRCARRRLDRDREWQKNGFKTGFAVTLGVVGAAMLVKLVATEWKKAKTPATPSTTSS